VLGHNAKINLNTLRAAIVDRNQKVSELVPVLEPGPLRTGSLLEAIVPFVFPSSVTRIASKTRRWYVDLCDFPGESQLVALPGACNRRSDRLDKLIA
jgi:hypothetical protein